MKSSKGLVYYIKPDVRRGDIVYCDLNDGFGSVQQGYRPVLVIQNDAGNRHSDVTLIAPITTKKEDSKMPTHVKMPSDVYPTMQNGSKVMLEQIIAVDMQRLNPTIITHLEYDEKEEVDKALRLSVGLLESQESSGKYTRGDIFLADLGFGCGREIKGFVPVVVVQNNKGNDNSPTLIVAPIILRKKATLPTHVKLRKRTGVKHDGVVLCEQLKTIDKSQVYGKFSGLSQRELLELDRALRVSLCLPRTHDTVGEKLVPFEKLKASFDIPSKSAASRYARGKKYSGVIRRKLTCRPRVKMMTQPQVKRFVDVYMKNRIKSKVK